MKTMAIEDLVRWAYLEELPKARPTAVGPSGLGNGWSAVGSYVQLLTVIDLNAYGVVPDLASRGAPHEDAMAIHDAVERLDGLVIDDFDADGLVSDMIHVGPQVLAALARGIDRATWVDELGNRCLRGGVGVLVRSRSILGNLRPPEAVVPSLVQATGPNGKPVWRRREKRAVRWDAGGEPIGWDFVEVDVKAGRDRVPRDAYRLEVLRPDPVEQIAERLRWWFWRAAMDALVEDLAGGLVDHVTTVREGGWSPWAGDAGAMSRVFTAGPWGAAVDGGGPRRPVALRRARRRKVVESVSEKTG